ncbi:MAG: hypothetical protein ACD_70C00147G0001 [uncultured bacterium]|nr:MAG: hypothetical protein ACD_70C00147G0001 [uncultured bacterium]
MTTQTVNTTVELLGKPYPVRCTAAEVPSLEAAAKWLNDQMTAIQASGKAINIERIAMITALNVAHQFLQLEQKQRGVETTVNQQLTHLQKLLDNAF